MNPFSQVVVRLAGVLAAGLVLTSVRADAPSSSAKSADVDAGPQPGILTPAPGREPRVNGPALFGARPGSPFLYTIPATGDRPMTFAAPGLPDGLKLDAATGQITGSVARAGEYHVTLGASNAAGKNEKAFRIVIGDKIALTPPMGWNSWNCWGSTVSQAKVLGSAKALVAKGLNNHGWTYINIDDGWQGPRGGDTNGIQPNPKFPDIKQLSDKVHGMGLKFGIYSTPWTVSYGGFAGSACDNADGTYTWIVDGDHDANYHIRNSDKYSTKKSDKTVSFATNDAAQWAEWGVDYLKYDWYPNDVASAETMSRALRDCGRDVVFSLSNSAPFEHAADWSRLANCWRTTGDITDTWPSARNIGFHQQKWAPFAGPGHWNDPDMLVVGNVGWGDPKPTRLTHNEQYTHMSLWCLLSAPLLIGCDLVSLDDFTVSLLSNDEVLAIDQDALGREATPIFQNESYAIYAKPLEDGSSAVGLFNLSSSPRKITVAWSDLKLAAPQRVRDMWRQQDAGVFPQAFSSEVNAHGVMLIRISDARAGQVLGAIQPGQ